MPRSTFAVQYPGEETASPFTTDVPLTASQVIDRYLATRQADPESPANFWVVEVGSSESLGPPVSPDQVLAAGKQYRVVRRTALAAAA